MASRRVPTATLAIVAPLKTNLAGNASAMGSGVPSGMPTLVCLSNDFLPGEQRHQGDIPYDRTAKSEHVDRLRVCFVACGAAGQWSATSAYISSGCDTFFCLEDRHLHNHGASTESTRRPYNLLGDGLVVVFCYVDEVLGSAVPDELLLGAMINTDHTHSHTAAGQLACWLIICLRGSVFMWMRRTCTAMWPLVNVLALSAH